MKSKIYTCDACKKEVRCDGLCLPRYPKGFCVFFTGDAPEIHACVSNECRRTLSESLRATLGFPPRSIEYDSLEGFDL